MLKIPNLEIKDYLGRKHVDGVPATQETFYMNMLNQVLVGLCEQKSDNDVKKFIEYQIYDYGMELLEQLELLREGFNSFSTEEKVNISFEACVNATNPVVALSLIRLEHAEQLLLALIEKYLPKIAKAAKVEAASFMADDLKICLHANGVPVADTSHSVFQMSGEDLLKEVPDFDMNFVEFLNIKHAVAAGLILPAQVIMAKCYSLKCLCKMYSDYFMKAKDTETWGTVNETMADLRFKYLERQIRFSFLALTGFVDAQHGMPRDEASAFIHSRF